MLMSLQTFVRAESVIYPWILEDPTPAGEIPHPGFELSSYSLLLPSLFELGVAPLVPMEFLCASLDLGPVELQALVQLLPAVERDQYLIPECALWLRGSVAHILPFSNSA